MKEITCIICPRGCRLRVDEENDYTVAGNACPRGASYGKAELTNPTRVVTSTVRCSGGNRARCPVKTSAPVPKERVFDVVTALDSIEVVAPTRIGQIVASNICNCNVDVVVTKNIDCACEILKGD